MIFPLIFYVYTEIYKYSMYSNGYILYTLLCRYFFHLSWNLFYTSVVSFPFRTCLLFLAPPKVAFCCTVLWIYQTVFIQWSIRGPLGVCLGITNYIIVNVLTCPPVHISGSLSLEEIPGSWKAWGKGIAMEHVDCPSQLSSAGCASLLSTQQHWEHPVSMLLNPRRCCLHQSTYEWSCAPSAAIPVPAWC